MSKLKTEQPREFWILVQGNRRVCLAEKPSDYDTKTFGPWLHVREVIEIKDIEINNAVSDWIMDPNFKLPRPSEAFEAGARWAIARLGGK